MGNSQNSSRRRSSSPRAVKHKKSPNRFRFGSKKRTAQRQQATSSTPSTIRSIKAKVSSNTTSKKNSKKRRSPKSSDAQLQGLW